MEFSYEKVKQVLEKHIKDNATRSGREQAEYEALVVRGKRFEQIFVNAQAYQKRAIQALNIAEDLLTFEDYKEAQGILATTLTNSRKARLNELA